MEIRKELQRRHWNKKKLNRLRALIMLLAIIGTLSFVINSYIKGIVYDTMIYKGIRIEELDVGGLSKEQAIKELQTKFLNRISDFKVIFQFEQQQWEYDASDLNAGMDIEKKVEQAYQLGRSGGVWDRFWKIKQIAKNGKKLELNFTYDRSKMEQILQEISQEVNLEPIDAKVQLQTNKKGKFIILSEQNGRKLNIDQTIEKVNQELKNRDRVTVTLEPEVVLPRVFAADLEQIKDKIASFKTSLGNSTSDRKHNIFLAANSFTGKVLQPGEVFSFNEATGERSYDNGYKDAPVITRDKSLEDGPGGGVCQTSTTLYNAVLLAGLEIVSRDHHSFPSSYVKPGFDATVNYPTTDFKFRNSRTTPIILIAYSSESNLVVDIYGKASNDNITYKLINDIYEEIPAPEPKIIEDKNGEYADKIKYKDEQYVKVQSRKGIKVRTYRISYQDGKEIKRELIADDFYRPIQGVIYIGTKERPVELPEEPHTNPQVPEQNGDEEAEPEE